MHQFVGLLWDASDQRGTGYARRVAERLQRRGDGWRRAFAADGMIVLQAGTRPPSSQAYLLPEGGGVVLGTLFRRVAAGYDASESAASIDLDQEEGTEIIRSGGRQLVDRFWGRYVAFVRDRALSAHYVLRDPSNRLACYVTRQDGVSVFFSDLDGLVDLAELRPTINWRRVVAQLVYSRIQVSATGLNEVSELQAGECVEIRHGSAPRRSFYWSPVPLCREAPVEDAAQAAAALRETVQGCTGAWASVYPSILHQLSGGLDSAIVLACLKRAPTRPSLVCVNFATPSAEGDERRYARAAAARAGVELIERTLDPKSVRLEQAFEVARFPAPMIYPYSIENDAIEAVTARQRGANASFSAVGGDNLFYQAIKTDFQPADYLRQQGLRPALLRVAWDTARLTRRSVWSVLGSALRYELGARKLERYDKMLHDVPLLNDDVVAEISADDLAHPWIKEAADLPIGKQQHIFALVNCQGYFFPYELAAVADIVFPLLSQPLIELCLRIPTYLLTSGGRDRSLARRAFADELPPEIRRRRTKGGMSAYYNTVVISNLPWLRDVLLNGALAGAKLINRPALEKCLHEANLVRGSDYSAIMDFLCVEAWLRSWSVSRRRVAA